MTRTHRLNAAWALLIGMVIGMTGTRPALAEDLAKDLDRCHGQSHWLGRPVDEARMQKVTKAYRIMGINDVATQDFSHDRLNVIIDSKGIIVRMYCG
ncbi:MAG: hypothetical protein FJX22_03600 [Alphaproteobacteria bacterium]|nr:hypothetical protein [Alphaproteobacteria bacterium]